MSIDKTDFAPPYITDPTPSSKIEVDAQSTTSSGVQSSQSTEVGDHGMRQQRGLSMWLAAFFLIGEMAGAGILSLPYSLANTGWIGVPLMIVICLAVGYSGTRLAKCWVLLEERWPQYRLPCRRPYPAIAYRALGKPGQIVAEVSMFLTLYGAATVYLLLTSTYLYQLLRYAIPPLSQCAWILVIGAILTPITMFSTPMEFWPASILAMGASLIASVVVVVSLVLNTDDYAPPSYEEPSFVSFFLGFGAVLFALGGASIFPTVQNDMKDRGQFSESVTICFLVLLAIYLPFSTICYGILGKNGTPPNILEGVQGAVIPYIKGLLVAHFIFAFIIVINPCNQTIEGFLDLPNEMGIKRVLVRISMMIILMVTGLAIPDFSKILNLIGGSTVTIMSFVLPPLCYLLLCRHKNIDGEPYRHLGVITVTMLCVIITMGIIGGVAASYSAVQDIISSTLNMTCFNKNTFFT